MGILEIGGSADSSQSQSIPQCKSRSIVCSSGTGKSALPVEYLSCALLGSRKPFPALGPAPPGRLIYLSLFGGWRDNDLLIWVRYMLAWMLWQAGRDLPLGTVYLSAVILTGSGSEPVVPNPGYTWWSPGEAFIAYGRICTPYLTPSIGVF